MILQTLSDFRQQLLFGPTKSRSDEAVGRAAWANVLLNLFIPETSAALYPHHARATGFPLTHYLPPGLLFDEKAEKALRLKVTGRGAF